MSTHHSKSTFGKAHFLTVGSILLTLLSACGVPISTESNTALSSQTTTSSIIVSPGSETVAAGTMIQFTATGGTAPYTYSIIGSTYTTRDHNDRVVHGTIRVNGTLSWCRRCQPILGVTRPLRSVDQAQRQRHFRSKPSLSVPCKSVAILHKRPIAPEAVSAQTARHLRLRQTAQAKSRSARRQRHRLPLLLPAQTALRRAWLTLVP